MSNNNTQATNSSSNVKQVMGSIGGTLLIVCLFAIKVWKLKLSTDDEVSENDAKKVRIIEGVMIGADSLILILFGYALYKQLTMQCTVPLPRKIFFGIVLLYFFSDRITTSIQGFGLINKAKEAKKLKDEKERKETQEAEERQ